MTSKKNKQLLTIALGLFALFTFSIALHFFGEEGSGTISADINQVINRTDNTTIAAEPETAFSGQIPILMYHHIRDYDNQNDPDGLTLSVTPNSFAEQLDMLKTLGYTTINFLDIENNNIPERPIILSFDDGYDNFYQNAFSILKEREMTAVVYVIAGKYSDQYINASQIKEIADGGIEIGSHTITHLNLTDLNGARINQELLESKSRLETIIEKPVVSFCYPAGKYNDFVIEQLKAVEYKYAVTTNPGIADFNNPYLLSRFRINHGTNIEGFLK
jgi:peptidoglycan/xylan/chitin deacetylase (PgdA/CDA1 family)